jgi:hypothetical protein
MFVIIGMFMIFVQNCTRLIPAIHNLMLTNQKLDVDFEWPPCSCFTSYNKESNLPEVTYIYFYHHPEFQDSRVSAATVD